MISLRDALLDNLVATLQLINGAPPYLLATRRVSRDLVHPSQINDVETPAVFISARREELAHRSFQRIENELAPVLTLVVKTLSPDDSPSRELEKLIADVKTAFYQDITRGGLAVTSLLGPQIRVPDGNYPPLAVAEIDTVIQYRHIRTTP